ncbi:MAG: hypothetical protein PHQ78_08190 [Candidatus Cloacimonetes bacterium]|jgi:hypothetical protein|nr:hypothetical protein [Candidatus Cloacimonadota bacterium]MDD2507271.1 hypothetical protein [Candidatus Cloacimonadota bacterium]MDD4560684.1 hypothetical protein [Candidatus Cloacimonadota bacterium]
MNRDFVRPAALLLMAAFFTGVLAKLLPAYSNDIFPIRKMSWFEALFDKQAPVDSLTMHHKTPEHASKELRPFIQKMRSMSPITGQSPLFDSSLLGKREKHIRIAYYSDSIIEGDLLTAPLRYKLQSVYGGQGVGMMPITSIVSGFRQTIQHKFSRNWESISFMNLDKNDVSLGITGYTFIPRPYYVASKTISPVATDTLFSADSLRADSLATKETEEPRTEITRFYVDYDPWVEYKGAGNAGGSPVFTRIKLFYSHASESSVVKVSYNSGPYEHKTLESGDELHALDISPDSPITTLKLEFSAHDPIHLYGVSFDEDKGVYVDNFPIRGYSGLYFQRIHENTLSAFQRYLDYDLVVMQYGGNISNPKNTNYENYKLAMTRTIRHLQKALKDVPILVVSVHDRSIKDHGVYKTSPDIPLLVKAQGDVALDTGCAFWNLYEAMGGYNSMLGYVHQNPPLAGKDFTHFTRRGADKIAELLIDFLRKEN